MNVFEKKAENMIKQHNLILCPHCNTEFFSLDDIEEVCEGCMEPVADASIEEFIWHPNKEY